MKETELNKVLNYMKQYVEDKYEHDSEPMLTYKDLQLVLDEIERLNNIIKDIKSQLTYLETYSSKEDVYEDMSRRLNRIEKIVGSDKE